jgi:hypothetical protein
VGILEASESLLGVVRNAKVAGVIFQNIAKVVPAEGIRPTD